MASTVLPAPIKPLLRNSLEEKRATSFPAPPGPAVPVAMALAGGILCDRTGTISLITWLTFVAVSLIVLGVLLVSRRAPRVLALSSLLLWGSVGGLRHHQFWSTRGDDNVRCYLSATGESPARVTARVVSAIVIERTEPGASVPIWMRIDRSLCEIECETIGAIDHQVSCSGRLHMDVTGHLIGPRIGDRIEVHGVLQQPGPVRNPGGFDFAAYQRSRGIDAFLRVSHPDHVRVVASTPTLLDRFRQVRNLLRQQCESLLERHLSPASRPVAASLLLGDRSGLERRTEQAFIESGTIHLLAISGLNVAILAGFLHLGCRLLKLSGPATVALLIVAVLGYAVLTDQQPSVMRAALMATIVLSGASSGRSSSGYHTLALCALMLLLLRPADLFDIGAQLSFLAVAAILWSNQWQQSQRGSRDPLVPMKSETTLFGRFLRGARQLLWSCYLLTGTVWLFTLPLTVDAFHLVTPIGLVVNVLLSPIVAVMLAAGYAGLLIGLIVPAVAGLPFVLFDWLLSLMLWLVEAGASVSLGHLWTPAPPRWWTIGFYLLLAVAVGLVRLPVTARMAFRTVALWMVFGLLLPMGVKSPEGLRCTFLSVGHGCAVLIETPDGRRLLYDAGCSSDGRRAQRVVQSALWLRGGHSLNGIIVSHADADHYNGIPDLLASIPVRSLYFAASFLDFSQPNIAPLCDAAAARNVQMQVIQAGDRLDLGSNVEVEILHPAGDFCGRDDNANSVVLRIRYAGRTILLTGDLAHDGLETLLGQPTDPIDILMSPHHGSLSANPSRLGDWAKPRYVVASTNQGARARSLADRFPTETRILSTDEFGAITAVIHPTGELSVNTHLNPSVTAELVATR